MTIEESLQALANSQASLRKLQQKLSQQSIVMKQEENQTFILELRDYVDSLSLITDFVEQVETKEVVLTEISTLLSEQNQLMQTILHHIEENVENDQVFLGQQEGELRRTLIGLKGILELNGLMLQDNLAFQRRMKDISLSAAPISETNEKQGFFQRIFGRK
jgi:hypothetical protein